MKVNLYILVLSASLILMGCSHKTLDPKIQELKSRESLLKKTEGLNQLRFTIREKETLYASLKEQTSEINRTASVSAGEARDLSDQVSRNPGDTNIASKANRASKQAAKDAGKAKDLNRQLNKTSASLNKLRKKESRLLEKLSKTERKIEFVPRQ